MAYRSLVCKPCQWITQRHGLLPKVCDKCATPFRMAALLSINTPFAQDQPCTGQRNEDKARFYSTMQASHSYHGTPRTLQAMVKQSSTQWRRTTPHSRQSTPAISDSRSFTFRPAARIPGLSVPTIQPSAHVARWKRGRQLCQDSALPLVCKDRAPRVDSEPTRSSRGSDLYQDCVRTP